MAQPSIDIEKIVREVLARFEQAPGEAAAPERKKQQPAKTPAAAESSGDLVIQCRVVSTTEVAGRLDGVRRLVVSRTAVVTPSVRDELIKRNIKLAKEDTPEPSSAGSRRVTLIVASGSFDSGPLVEALRGEDVEARVETSGCLIAATDALAEELSSPDEIGLLVTGHPAAALCLANRHQSVRAVSASDAGRLAESAASVGANLAVLDPKRTSPFQLKQMAVRFVKRGPAQCPAQLQERLG